MQDSEWELGPRAYTPEHVSAVLAKLAQGFPRYFQSFCPSASAANLAIAQGIAAWKSDHPKYCGLLSPDALEEYEDDPDGFKGDLRRKCPIIHRCLNSPLDEIKDYKRAFNTCSPRDLLDVTREIVAFAEDYIAEFDGEEHESAKTYADLGLSELDQEEDYTLYGVIGGGIRSRFLYSLYPKAFPNRSQDAVWGLYFLTDGETFGFEDGSEFLMYGIVRNKSKVQQNYRYPYDLFTFYSLRMYLMLKPALEKERVRLEPDYRYIYLDAFLNHVSARHRGDIALMRGTNDDVHW